MNDTSMLLNITFHAPMRRFQLEFILFYCLFIIYLLTQDLKNISDTQKANPNSLNISLRKDTK